MKLTGILFLFFTSFGLTAHAQEENESSFPSSAPTSWARAPYCYTCKKRHYSGCTPTTPPPTNVPIDGGLGFLLAAGAAYGVRRMKKAPKSR
jgi:hypothetical protein